MISLADVIRMICIQRYSEEKKNTKGQEPAKILYKTVKLSIRHTVQPVESHRQGWGQLHFLLVIDLTLSFFIFFTLLCGRCCRVFASHSNL